MPRRAGLTVPRRCRPAARTAFPRAHRRAMRENMSGITRSNMGFVRWASTGASMRVAIRGNIRVHMLTVDGKHQGNLPGFFTYCAMMCDLKLFVGQL